MKILTSPEFNNDVKQLSEHDGVLIYNWFNNMSQLSKHEILSMRHKDKFGFQSLFNEIYEFRISRRPNIIKLFATFEKKGREERMILIHVEKTNKKGFSELNLNRLLGLSGLNGNDVQIIVGPQSLNRRAKAPSSRPKPKYFPRKKDAPH